MPISKARTLPAKRAGGSAEVGEVTEAELDEGKAEP
jgi:hypothetical protein